jgi:hypothetical protein
MKKEKSYPNYIGKKIKGFKFESTKDVSWLEEKSGYIGRIGEITCQDIYRVGVHFDDDYWYYPIDLVEQHLVEEEPKLPERGEEILVWDYEEDEPEKRIFVSYIEGAIEPIHTYTWRYWKPIPSVKEYTHKELEQKLGEKFIYKN